jgi:hypothetical protein
MTRERPEAGPADAVVELMEGNDQVPLGSRRDVGPWQSTQDAPFWNA